MILHKDCLPIERSWQDEAYCDPFVYPWEVYLTKHFGCEHLPSQVYAHTIELVDDAGNPAGDITASFDTVIGQDSANKNVFVSRLAVFPPTLSTNFRLLVTIRNSGNVVFREVTEAYVYRREQCVTAYVVSSPDWTRIAGGRLVINGDHYNVAIDGTGLPAELVLGVNAARQETSLSGLTGFVYEIYGEDAAGTVIPFQNLGTICATSDCSDKTLLLEGIFDCMAPDGRFLGSVYPYDEEAPDVRYRYFSRVAAVITEVPAQITRTIAVNGKVQRSERIRRYQLRGTVPLPKWKKEELETVILGAKIIIQGEAYTFTTGTAFEPTGLPGHATWWLKADLELNTERKEYSCEVVCYTCLAPTGLGFTINPMPCSPLTGVQATVTLEDSGTARLEVIGSNTAGASYFQIGYRVQGSGAPYTPITPNPVALPAVVTGLPVETYEVSITKVTGSSSCPAQVVVSNATQLSEFDYLVVRYIWGEDDGRDLDTFTGFINTGTTYDNQYVGYGQNSGQPKIPATAVDADAYLFWALDNTQSGVEAVMVNFKQFVEDNPGIPVENQVRMNAVWWSQRISGDVQVQLTTYLGGTMSKVGFDFVNTGGVQVDQVTLDSNVAANNQTKNINNSSNVSIIRYNKNTKEATIQLI